MSQFSTMFETLVGCGFETFCSDEDEKPLTPRRLMNGGYVFDGFAPIASIGIRPAGLVTVCGPKSRPKGYHVHSVNGSFSDETPQFKNEPQGLYYWILRPPVRFPVGQFVAHDQDGNRFGIHVHGEGTKRILSLPPSPGLRWITEVVPVYPPPLVPMWITRVVTDLGAQHVGR